MKKTALVALLLLISGSGLRSGLMAQSGDRRLNTALSFEREGRYDEALTNYLRLFDSGASEEIVLRAKLGAGRIYMEVLGDLDKAKSLFSEAANQVRFHDLAAQALVYNGKAKLATASSLEELDSAVSEFETVIRTYPASQAMPQALMNSASIYERQRKYVEAIANYQAIVFQYPQSRQAGHAFRRLGRSLVKIGEFTQAMDAYQNAQSRHAGTAASDVAQSEGSLVFRLFVLPTRQQKPYLAELLAAKSKQLPLNSPQSLAVTEEGDLLVDDSKRVLLLSPQGGLQSSGAASRIDFRDRQGNIYRLAKNSVTSGQRRLPVPFFLKKDGKKENFNHITSLAVDGFQQMMISTKGPEGLYRVNRETGEVSLISSSAGASPKMLLDSEDNLYVLSRDESALLVFDRWGENQQRMSASSFGIKKLRDFALDSLDNLYLLDSDGQFIVAGSLSLGESLRLKAIHRQTVLDSRSRPLSNLQALAVAGDGAVYVAGKKEIMAFR